MRSSYKSVNRKPLRRNSKYTKLKGGQNTGSGSGEVIYSAGVNEPKVAGENQEPLYTSVERKEIRNLKKAAAAQRAAAQRAAEEVERLKAVFNKNTQAENKKLKKIQVETERLNNLNNESREKLRNLLKKNKNIKYEKIKKYLEKYLEKYLDLDKKIGVKNFNLITTNTYESSHFTQNNLDYLKQKLNAIGKKSVKKRFMNGLSSVKQKIYSFRRRLTQRKQMREAEARAKAKARAADQLEAEARAAEQAEAAARAAAAEAAEAKAKITAEKVKKHKLSTLTQRLSQLNENKINYLLLNLNKNTQYKPIKNHLEKLKQSRKDSTFKIFTNNLQSSDFTPENLAYLREKLNKAEAATTYAAINHGNGEPINNLPGNNPKKKKTIYTDPYFSGGSRYRKNTKRKQNKRNLKAGKKNRTMKRNKSLKK
jgi:hypothetical protein